MGSGGIATHIPNLSTRWKWRVSPHPGHFTTREWYPIPI